MVEYNHVELVLAAVLTTVLASSLVAASPSLPPQDDFSIAIWTRQWSGDSIQPSKRVTGDLQMLGAWSSKKGLGCFTKLQMFVSGIVVQERHAGDECNLEYTKQRLQVVDTSCHSALHTNRISNGTILECHMLVFTKPPTYQRSHIARVPTSVGYRCATVTLFNADGSMRWCESIQSWRSRAEALQGCSSCSSRGKMEMQAGCQMYILHKDSNISVGNQTHHDKPRHGRRLLGVDRSGHKSWWKFWVAFLVPQLPGLVLLVVCCVDINKHNPTSHASSNAAPAVIAKAVDIPVAHMESPGEQRTQVHQTPSDSLSNLPDPVPGNSSLPTASEPQLLYMPPSTEVILAALVWGSYIMVLLGAMDLMESRSESQAILIVGICCLIVSVILHLHHGFSWGRMAQFFKGVVDVRTAPAAAAARVESLIESMPSVGWSVSRIYMGGPTHVVPLYQGSTTLKLSEVRDLTVLPFDLRRPPTFARFRFIIKIEPADPESEAKWRAADRLDEAKEELLQGQWVTRKQHAYVMGENHHHDVIFFAQNSLGKQFSFPMTRLQLAQRWVHECSVLLCCSWIYAAWFECVCPLQAVQLIKVFTAVGVETPEPSEDAGSLAALDSTG